jgi:hypothetical protein
MWGTGHGWEHNSKIDLKETGFGVVEWVLLTRVDLVADSYEHGG